MSGPVPLPAGGENAVAVTLGLIGDEWTLLILRYALAGTRRFTGWLDRLPISTAVLTQRLSRLTEAGLMRREAYQSRPERFEYPLTGRGRDTWPILLGIWSWELAWVPDQAERLPRMVHATCDQEFRPVLGCAACRAPVEPRDVAGGFGPSGTWQRSVPAATTRRRSATAGLFPQTMALLGNRWSAAMLGAAFLGARRFTDFERWLGAPPTVVADRLRTFGDLGVLAPAPGDRTDRVSYRLTAKGRAFFPVVMAAVDWGQRWYRAPEGPALLVRHIACARAFHPSLECDRCHDQVHGRDVRQATPVDLGRMVGGTPVSSHHSS